MTSSPSLTTSVMGTERPTREACLLGAPLRPPRSLLRRSRSRREEPSRGRSPPRACCCCCWAGRAAVGCRAGAWPPPSFGRLRRRRTRLPFASPASSAARTRGSSRGPLSRGSSFLSPLPRRRLRRPRRPRRPRLRPHGPAGAGITALFVFSEHTDRCRCRRCPSSSSTPSLVPSSSSFVVHVFRVVVVHDVHVVHVVGKLRVRGSIVDARERLGGGSDAGVRCRHPRRPSSSSSPAAFFYFRLGLTKPARPPSPFKLSRVLVAMPAGHVRLEVVGRTVFDVQESGALLADVDEGGLHAGQHAGNLAEHDVANRAASSCTFDLQLGNHSPFDQRNTGFTNIAIDDQRIFGHVPRTERFSREKEIFRADLVLLHEGAFRPPAPKAAAWAPARGKTVTLAEQRTTVVSAFQVAKIQANPRGSKLGAGNKCFDSGSLSGPPGLPRRGFSSQKLTWRPRFNRARGRSARGTPGGTRRVKPRAWQPSSPESAAV